MNCILLLSINYLCRTGNVFVVVCVCLCAKYLKHLWMDFDDFLLKDQSIRFRWRSGYMIQDFLKRVLYLLLQFLQTPRIKYDNRRRRYALYGVLSSMNCFKCRVLLLSIDETHLRHRPLSPKVGQSLWGVATGKCAVIFPRRRTSPPVSQYHITLPSDRGTTANNLPRVAMWYW